MCFNKFTVVIPLYNKEHIFHKCIASVLSQEYSNYDIVIVDDGSTDNSYLVAESYKNKYPNKITLLRQANSGVSIARNKGIENSENNYICFLDADDEWAPYFLANISLLIEKFPDAGLYCLQHETRLSNRTVSNRSCYKNEYFGVVDDFFKCSIVGSIANSSKVCVRKNILNEIGGFPSGYKSGEDLFVWMEIALKYPVAFYNKVSVVINVLSDSSRVGRSVSSPYPFVYYSDSCNYKKLTFWAKIYLYKIFMMHVGSSARSLHYEGFVVRADAGKYLFPVSVFFLKLLKLPLKVISRNE